MPSSEARKEWILSWRWITVGKAYDNSYNYDRSKESHLMKNSEWGAVAYLTHSQYGRNGTEITMNDKNFYTGGLEKATATTNKAQSTTGNAYGVYDLNGGAWERVAGYITNGNESLKEYGSTTVSFPLVATFTKDTEGYKTLSTKYSTVYPFNTTTDSNLDNWTTYNNIKSDNYGYGDAILETSSTEGSDFTSWFKDFFIFANTSDPFFLRGGGYLSYIRCRCVRFHWYEWLS